MKEARFDHMPGPRESTFWKAALGIHSASRMDLIAQVQQGLPATAFDRFSKVTGLSREALAKAINTSTRTVSRRKEAGRRLDQGSSERLVRLASLYSRASETVGSEALARQWMQTPRDAFAGKTPFEMAQTELGAREVEDLLLRVEHGVFY